MTLPSIVGKNGPLLVASGLAVVGVLVFRVYLNWGALVLTVRLQDLTGLLAPLAFAAACIERAVEIFVSPWRDAEASKLAKEVAAIQARPAEPAACAQNAADLKAASDRLDEYRGSTQRYAFAASLTLSVLVSMAGVRALGSFVGAEKLKDQTFTDGSQYLFFLCVDVVLSAALLAGGADGIHSLVNAATSFFNSTAAKASNTP
jgi:hypothetical protein